MVRVHLGRAGSRHAELLAPILLLGALAAAPAAAHEPPDTLFFTPAGPDSTRIVWVDEETVDAEQEEPGPIERWRGWPRMPYGDRILTDPEEWTWPGWRTHTGALLVDYNRVDLLRLGLDGQIHPEPAGAPRLGARFEYAFGRERWMYGIQVEQPVLSGERLSLGVSMTRRTDHLDLQQTVDWENSLALLFARQDYRDYFEREGFGAYATSALGDVTSASVHLRSDRYRSLPLDHGTRSWFNRGVALRGNPPVADGEARTLSLRFERMTRRAARAGHGLAHWVALEHGGGRLGGDFRYTRGLADLRGMLRLSPATTLALRAIAGATFDGTLPPQRAFTLGGPDGLRAHNTATMRGDQALLLQAEYDLDLWSLRRRWFQGGLRALVFVEAGRAWHNGGAGWDVDRQRLAVDGGFGFATGEDGFRLYFAQNLQEPRPDLNVSLRLQRPF